MTDKEKIAHDLTLLYLSMYDNPQEEKQKNEGEFVGRYANCKDRILKALPDEAENME